METENPATSTGKSRVSRGAACVLSFVLGVLTAWLLKFFLFGTTVNLSAEAFVTLVFTIAVGAASTILALMAINYGRTSEKIITDRTDKSIDIQMRLFEKSLSLQTQLFDKTMSTLEAIGRSTGVTEQRLGDLHTLLQSPELRKQIAGKAVDDLKVGGKPGERPVETHVAEQLAGNIVRQVAQTLEPSQASPPSSQRPPRRTIQQDASFEETFLKERDRALRRQEAVQLQEQVHNILNAIPGAKTLPAAQIPLWDMLFEYKGKRIGVDIRSVPATQSGVNDDYDESIKLLASVPADCLIFVFAHPPAAIVTDHISRRSDLVGGAVKVVVAEVVGYFDLVPCARINSMATSMHAKAD